MGPQDWYSFLSTGGPLAMLIGVLMGLYLGWWVPGPFYRELKEQNRKLQETNDRYEDNFKTIIKLLEENPPARRGTTR